MKLPRSVGLVVALATIVLAQDGVPGLSPNVHEVSQNAAAGAQKPGTVVVGTLQDTPNGHVVIGWKGKDGQLRLYDGNIAGAIRDAGSKPLAKMDPKDVARIYTYLRGERIDDSKRMSIEIPPTAGSYKDHAKLLAATEKLWSAQGGTDAERSAKVSQRYAENGNTVGQSFKQGQKVLWFTQPGDIAKVRQAVESFNIPKDPAGRCSQFYHKALGGSGQANDIEVQLAKEAQRTHAIEDKARNISPPRCEEPRPVMSDKPRQMKAIDKPGGTVLAATGTIDEIDPAAAETATFDRESATLTIRLRSGEVLHARVVPDDFIVAVRAVYQDKVDPVLSISHSKEHPGFKQIDYTGPLFRTHLGSVLYEADALLGRITFGSDPTLDETVEELIPGYQDLLSISAWSWSRVFLQAGDVRFKIGDGGELQCVRCACAVSVEGIGANRTHKSHGLERVARAMDERFDALADRFDAFSDFREAAKAVALVKWLRMSDATLDVAKVAEQKVEAVDFPGLAPSGHWTQLVRGRTLDHLAVDAPAGLKWSRTADGFSIEATAGPVDVGLVTWAEAFDVRATFTARGPIQLVDIGSKDEGIPIEMDPGEPATIEAFVRPDTLAISLPKSGAQVPMLTPKGSRQSIGLRVMPGSKLDLVSFEVHDR